MMMNRPLALAAAIVFVFVLALFPKPAQAQGPTSCAAIPDSYPYSVLFDFENGSDNGWTGSFFNLGPNSTYCADCPPMQGNYWMVGGSSLYDMTTQLDQIELGNYFNLTYGPNSSDAVQYYYVTGLAFDYDSTTNTPLNGEARIRFLQAISDTAITDVWTIAPGGGQYAWYPNRFAPVDYIGLTNWWHSHSVDNIQVDGCYTLNPGYDPPTIPPVLPAPCSSLAEADFQSAQSWTLGGSAAITNSVLSLPAPGDYATQAITLTAIAPATAYAVTISATAVISNAPNLLVSLAGATVTATITEPNWYTITLLTDYTITNQVIRLESLTGTLDIDYVCISEGSSDTDTCGTVRNSHFFSDQFWDLANNAFIENSNLILAVSDAVSQTLNLLPETDYGVLIVGNPAISTSSILVELGDDSYILNLARSPGAGGGQQEIICQQSALEGGSSYFEFSPVYCGVDGVPPDATDITFFARIDTYSKAHNYTLSTAQQDQGPLCMITGNQPDECESDINGYLSAVGAALIDIPTGTGEAVVSFGFRYVIDVNFKYDNIVFTTGPDGSLPLSLTGLTGLSHIDFICLYQLSSGYQYGNCITNLIPNGGFDTPAGWVWVNGAVHNDVGDNAWIPHVDGGTWANGGLGAVGRPRLDGVPPTLKAGEYLILQFDARAGQDEGIISARYRNSHLTNTVELTYTFSVQAQYFTYQTDFSQLAGDASNIEIGFFNNTYQFSQTEGVYLDNVCLFVSGSPAQLPYPAGGYIGLGVTCATVSYWLSDTLGINLPALETMAAPSLWDVDQWVPWLASRLWVNAGKPLACLMIALFNSGPGLALLNALDWMVRQPPLLLAWFAGWFALLVTGLGLWLNWYATPLKYMLAVFPSLQAVLSWLGSVVGWLWDVLQAVSFWLAGHLINWAVSTLNALVLAWNILLPFISAAWSEMVDVFVRLWNGLAPSLGGVLGFFDFILGLFGELAALAALFFTAIWRLAQLAWSFLSGAANLPLQFYYAFNDSVNSTAFELIPACAGDITQDWCKILFGFEIVNQTTSHTITYPIVIVGIVIATVMIFWRHVWELFTLKLR